MLSETAFPMRILEHLDVMDRSYAGTTFAEYGVQLFCSTLNPEDSILRILFPFYLSGAIFYSRARVCKK